MDSILETEISQTSQPLLRRVQSACMRIPPLWPLKNFVAVNPFVGLSNRHFIEAAKLTQRIGHGEMLMPASYYCEQISLGRIREDHFQAAVKIAAASLPADWAKAIDLASLHSLKVALETSHGQTGAPRVLTFADFLDAHTGSNWAAFVVEEISKWCSAYFDQGQSSWRMPWRDRGLFNAWKAAAKLDLNPELMGLERFREFVAKLPDDPMELIARALGTIDVPGKMQVDFLHRQLMSLSGWSSYVQYLVRKNSMDGQMDDSLAQLLAIRLAYDQALQQHSGKKPDITAHWQRQIANLEKCDQQVCFHLLARYIAQQALESAYQSELIAKLRNQPGKPTACRQKSLQAIFCIDVRSEVFRRALEAQSDEIETLGFAGFFGMAIEYLKFGQAGSGARCPVLLSPKIKVRESLHHADANAEDALQRKMNFLQKVNGAWNSFKTSAISCFSFVETAGLWYGFKLIKDSLASTSSESAFAVNGGRRQLGPEIKREVHCTGKHGLPPVTGMGLPEQIALAAGSLRNMGLTSNFAQVVLFCGHGSATANNPYGSALDCGACGGHAGDANARVAATLLNEPAVQAGLKRQGIEIPTETVFIAGLHNTTTDEIVIYDAENLTAQQQLELAKIKNWLKAASQQARHERAASLGLAGVPPGKLEARLFRRSRDWSQVRPEWGLAGNAAFIAAPRERTMSLNLGGRAFLHNYNVQLDPEKSTLELIMVAPIVVASWINLQYYGSTVNNRLFGSGNKALHNVVGTFGVWQGNGGDLQPGLPLQSVHDGTRWIHEPLRLSVFIEAAGEDLAAILAKQPGVRELVENGWLNLFVLEASGKNVRRYCRNEFVEEPNRNCS